MATKGNKPVDANEVELSENELGNVAGGFGGQRMDTRPVTSPYVNDNSNNTTNPGRRNSPIAENE